MTLMGKSLPMMLLMTPGFYLLGQHQGQGREQGGDKLRAPTSRNHGSIAFNTTTHIHVYMNTMHIQNDKFCARWGCSQSTHVEHALVEA